MVPPISLSGVDERPVHRLLRPRRGRVAPAPRHCDRPHSAFRRLSQRYSKTRSGTILKLTRLWLSYGVGSSPYRRAKATASSTAELPSATSSAAPLSPTQ